MGDGGEGGEAVCATHRAKAVAECKRCGDYLCDDCRVWDRSEPYCVKCHNYIVTEGGKRSPSSTVRRGLVLGCGAALAVGLVVVVIAVFFFWGLSREMDSYKPAAAAAADAFTVCFYASDTACLREKTSWDPEVLRRSTEHGPSFARKLGSRISATPVEDSWSLRTGKEKTLSVVFDTAFDNDPNARETFVFIVRGQDLVVQRYHVNSEKLLEEAPGGT